MTLLPSSAAVCAFIGLNAGKAAVQVSALVTPLLAHPTDAAHTRCCDCSSSGRRPWWAVCACSAGSCRTAGRRAACSAAKATLLRRSRARA